jgi:hypothetical protein
LKKLFLGKIYIFSKYHENSSNILGIIIHLKIIILKNINILEKVFKVFKKKY